MELMDVGDRADLLGGDGAACLWVSEYDRVSDILPLACSSISNSSTLYICSPQAFLLDSETEAVPYGEWSFRQAPSVRICSTITVSLMSRQHHPRKQARSAIHWRIGLPTKRDPSIDPGDLRHRHCWLCDHAGYRVSLSCLGYAGRRGH